VAIKVLGVEHIDLTVNDVARSREFYDKVLGALGFRLLDQDEDVRWGNAHMTLAIRPVADSQRAVSFDSYRVGLHHLALKVRARDDVDEIHRLLVRERFTVLDPPAEYPQYGPDYYAVFFSDPDGMKLEVVHFPWGYWRRVQTQGSDPRARYDAK